MAEEEGNKLVQVDWCGFGFTKVHRSIYEQMKYPYYPLRDAFIEKCNHPTKKGEMLDVKDLSFEDVSFCRNCYEQTKIKPFLLVNKAFIIKLRCLHILKRELRIL